MFLAAAGCRGSGDGEPHVYSTWETLELDKCAAAWLLKRFIDKQATFKLYPVGTLEMDGTPFDTPSSEYRRSQSLSCYETVLQRHGVNDPRLAELGRLVRDIEVNYWTTTPAAPARNLNNRIQTIIQAGKPPAEALEESFVVFDEFWCEMLHVGGAAGAAPKK